MTIEDEYAWQNPDSPAIPTREQVEGSPTSVLLDIYYYLHAAVVAGFAQGSEPPRHLETKLEMIAREIDLRIPVRPRAFARKIASNKKEK